MTDELAAPKNETPQAEIPKSEKKLCLSAMVSLLSGILIYALLLFCNLINIKFIVALFLAPIPALIAIIAGVRAKRKIRRADGALTGKKLANTGLWLGWTYIILAALVGIGIIAGIGGLLSLLGIG